MHSSLLKIHKENFGLSAVDTNASSDISPYMAEMLGKLQYMQRFIFPRMKSYEMFTNR